MKDQVLDSISPIQYKDTFLIPITRNIQKLFENEKIKFQISIKDNKIILESPKILADLDLLDNHHVTDITNVN